MWGWQGLKTLARLENYEALGGKAAGAQKEARR